MFARHFAWLSAVPDGQKTSRRELFTRAAKRDPDLPPADPVLVDYFYRMGPSRATGMGAVPVSWAELHAFQQCLRVEFSKWVSETLYLMSAAFVGQLYESKARECPPPWMPDGKRSEDKASMNEGILKAFESVKSTKPTNRKGLRGGTRNNSVQR